MNNMILNGQDSVATSAVSNYYFDCATNSYERGVVYDNLTPENLEKWYKGCYHIFPIKIMGQDNFKAWLKKENGVLPNEEGDYILKIYREDRKKYETYDEWTVRIGKRITKTRWNAIVKIINEYLDGTLEKNYKGHNLVLA